MTTVVKGNASDKIADLLSSATLVILLKKDEETMDVMKKALGDVYIQPQRPLGMGSTIVKIASKCTLIPLYMSLGAAVGLPNSRSKPMGGATSSNGRCKWPWNPMGPSMLAVCLHGINAFGEIERVCIRAAM